MHSVFIVISLMLIADVGIDNVIISSVFLVVDFCLQFIVFSRVLCVFAGCSMMTESCCFYQ